MKKLISILPGILLCLAIATPAWLLGKTVPLIGGPVFGIVFGMIVVLIWPKLASTVLFSRASQRRPASRAADALSPSICLGDGIKYTSKKLLQFSIILLGFEMNLFNVIRVGGQSLFVMLFTLSAAFLTAFLAGKALKLAGKMTTLIGVGTSICGGSAIAATAPVIGAEDEEVAHAISTIFLFNIMAVFIFPALGHLLGLSDIGFGMWAGTAINDTSSVVAAGAAWSAAAGNNTALAFATIVKLTRTLMIVPITLVLAIHTTNKSRGNHPVAHSASGSAVSSGSSEFNLVRIFPWFVIGFLLTALLNTFAGIPANVSHFLVNAGKFVIVMAMSAIGLNTHLKKLLTNGIRPILLGLCCWFAVASVSLLVQVLMGAW